MRHFRMKLYKVLRTMLKGLLKSSRDYSKAEYIIRSPSEPKKSKYLHCFIVFIKVQLLFH